MDTEHGGTDAVCVGETMALLVPDPPAAGPRAATFRRELGGAESNVAIHLARKRQRVAWHGILGSDGFGDYIAERLTHEGVECTAGRHPERPTGLYLKEYSARDTRVRYYRHGSAGATLGACDADAIRNMRPRVLHTTGITAALSESARELLNLLLTQRAPETLHSFDVNYRHALHDGHSGDMLAEMARRADVVFCGLDEAQALWNVSDAEQVRELLPEPGMVVVKQGDDGATAFADGHCWSQPAPSVDVVEPVGAGDAFAAGVLHGLLERLPVGECLAHGSQLAGQVLRVDGDIPPACETTLTSRRE